VTRGRGRLIARVIRRVLACLLPLLLAGRPALGQSPPESPRTFAFLDSLPPGAAVVTRGRFQILHYPDEARLAQSFLVAAWRGDDFAGLPVLRDTVRIALAPDEETFRDWVGDGVPDWGAAFAFPRERLIVMRGRDESANRDPLRTLRHEIAHLALAEAIGPVPRWFDEGYASYVAGEWDRSQVIETSVGLVWRGVPTLAGLDSGFYAGAATADRTYALAHRAVAELVSLDPERPLELLFRHWKTTGSFGRALRAAHGITELDFEQRFKSSVRAQYGLLAIGADLSLLAVVLVVLLGPLWWRKRRELRERLDRMRAAEAAQEARERASALAALLGEGADGPRANGPAASGRPQVGAD
jgi:hypothetical protein